MFKIRKYLILLLLLINIQFAFASEPKELIVGTKVSPPFSMKNSKGEWEGVSIELWKELAKKLHLKYRFQEETLDSMLNNLKEKKIDVAISALTVTAKREMYVDFSQSYYTTNLTIAIPREKGNFDKKIFNKLFSIESVIVIIGMAIVIIIAGFAFYFMERNVKDRDKITVSDGLWWAIVTMTTVGYGDKTPVTKGGKFVAIIWMFLSIFLVAGLIAATTSMLTTAKMDYFISKESDLNKGLIGTIKASVSDKYLNDRNVEVQYFNTIKDAVKAVKSKKIDGFVYDEAILRYIVDKNYSRSVIITDARFIPQNYSIALQNGSKLREKLNIELLKFIETPAWRDIKKRYFLKQ